MAERSKSRSVYDEPSTSVRLSSWKEIAAYLHRDPRTAQLWEKCEGLPIHRLEHQSRASVYAYTREIDAWLRARSEPPPAEKLKGEGKDASGLHMVPVIPLVLVLLFLAALAGVTATVKGIKARNAGPPDVAQAVPVLAVLPFEEQTATEGPLANDLTEELIADLARLGKVTVIARNSVFSFKGAHLTMGQVASRLHATLVLRGTVARTQEQVQVTVELLDAPRNTHLWGASYVRQAGDDSALMQEMASAIAAEVTGQIQGAAVAAPAIERQEDAQARQAYLAGRFYWNQRTPEGFKKAIALFRQALAIDPKYADAYAGLAETYVLMTDRGGASDASAFIKAKSAAETALGLDPENANAYNALAFATYRQDWDFVRAEQYFRKAVALRPEYAVAHQWYGEFLGDMRRFDQSIDELRKAENLDPLSPMVGSDLADGYMHAGRLTEADAELGRIEEIYPDFLPAYIYRIQVQTRMGKLDAAAIEAEKYQALSHDGTPLQVVRIEQMSAMGNVDGARRQLSGLLGGAAGRSFSAYRTAQLRFLVGEDDPGYTDLEQAYRRRSWWLVTMLVDPGFDSVRSQPRFIELARRVGLPQFNQPSEVAYSIAAEH